MCLKTVYGVNEKAPDNRNRTRVVTVRDKCPKMHTDPIYLTLKDDLDLNLFALEMCGFMKYICIPYMKYLSVLVQKLWPMFKKYL